MLSRKNIVGVAVVQRYPLPGEQRADNESVRIERWVEGSGIEVLNDMFERCTRFRVEDRMSMSELRDGLGQWLSKYAPRRLVSERLAAHQA